MERIGKYEVLGEIGAGGFGVVYKGRDPVLKRTVAIKVCNTDSEEVRLRFRREAEIVASLQHRHITTIHDLGEHDGLPFIVQEFLSGEDLSHIIARRDPLPLGRRIIFLGEIARGLEHAHEHGIVHRDIKPGNIRVLDDGTIKVMDFGIAKLANLESQLTKTGMMLGTAAYLSPEQIDNLDIDHRSDIFSFGVLAYELLTFERPFHAETLSALLYNTLHKAHRPVSERRPEVPPELSRLIDECLAKKREDRPESFGVIRERLTLLGATSGAIEDSRTVALLGMPQTGSATVALTGQAPAEGAQDETLEKFRLPRVRTLADPDAKTIAEVRVTPQPPAEPAPQPAPEPVRPAAAAAAPGRSRVPMLVMTMLALAAVTALIAVLLTRRGASSEPGAGREVPAQTGPATVAEPSPVAPPATDTGTRQPSGARAAAATPPAAASTAPDSERPAAPASAAVPATREPAPQPTAGSSNGSAGAQAASRTEPSRAPLTREVEPPPAEPVNAVATAPATSTRPADEAPSEPQPGEGAAPPPPAGTAADGAATASSPSGPEPPEPPATVAAPAPEVGIRATLERYRQAYEALEAQRLGAIWPSLSRDDMGRIQRSFDSLSRLAMTIEGCRIDVSGDHATASCNVRRTIHPKAGSSQSVEQQTTFRLVHRDEQWLIESL